MKSFCVIVFCADAVSFKVALRASVTQLTRVAASWKATIVDCLRYPLDDKVLYHECGEFFNLSSIKMLYDRKEEEVRGWNSLLVFIFCFVVSS